MDKSGLPENHCEESQGPRRLVVASQVRRGYLAGTLAWAGFCVEAGFVAAELGVDVFEGERGKGAFADFVVECGAVEFAGEAAEPFDGAAARGDAVGD